MGPAGALALGLGVVFSVGGGSLTSLLTAPRLTFALSRDGSLPSWFGKVNEKSRTPVNSILFCGVFSMGLAVSHGFVWLVTLSTFVRLLRSEEHTSELQSLMRISYAVFCLNKKTNIIPIHN